MPHFCSKFSEAAQWPLVLWVFLLTACTGIPVERDNPRYAQLDPSYTIQNLSYYPQIDDQCGPSSLATLLSAQGIDERPELLREKIYIPGKEGTVTTELIARARRYELLVYPLAPEFVDVLAEINAGNPVLVMQNLGFSWYPRWHFSVAMAYDLNKQTIGLRSAKELKYEVDFGLFIKTWQRANSWAIVITSPQRLAATATEKGAIKAANELEQIGELKTALASYKSILTKWPKSAAAAFGAGNTAYAQGDYSAAEQFFSTYIELQPTASQGWNNLAYTLAQLDCIAEAKKAINCALKIDPKNKNIIKSVEEITRYQDAESNISCNARECLAD